MSIVELLGKDKEQSIQLARNNLNATQLRTQRSVASAVICLTLIIYNLKLIKTSYCWYNAIPGVVKLGLFTFK